MHDCSGNGLGIMLPYTTAANYVGCVSSIDLVSEL